jgi:hypothetical protein
MDPGAGTTATSYKLQAASLKPTLTKSYKLQDTKVQITQPEGLRQNEAASCGKLSQRQSVMLTAKLTQEPGILTQASSDKLRHNASVKQNLPVRKYLLTNQQKG